jgi:hypothetical protein
VCEAVRPKYQQPHEQALVKMAYAAEQKWITVQQKTFTKWLNTKIAARNVEVKDLTKDLSDGVRDLLILYLSLSQD